MAKNAGAIKSGWHRDIINGYMSAYYDGIETLRFTLSSDGNDVRLFGDTPASNYFDFDASSPRFKITSGTAGAGRLEVHQGDLKIHNHDISSGYAAEFKAEYTATEGTHYAIQPTTQCTGTFAGDAMGGIYNNFYIASGYTPTAGYLTSHVNSFINQGTLNGSGINCGPQWNLIGDGGTYTSVAALSCLWLDTHLDQAVASGAYYMLDITVNGDTSPDALIHMYSADSTNAIFYFDGNEATAVSLTGTPGIVTGATGWIKVNMRGTTRYIALTDSVS